eukprot:CAMPEP_0205833654 /NCGR_PEP_ID=MMETSP0206-20130828/50149_1 /ASSEMBLY_ACC=CAM_ASM_000279 /TAXON_ID=36767 /ORGANISM="Euplotes focardii, Strain TN1" /LENGTH=386 /DNA_ID=CAMNT_0053140241 /DNA_START=23 /DNA_END=1183 /DNA_ORIENTATION=+
MKNLFAIIAFAAVLGVALSAIAVDLDRDGIADIIIPSTSVSTIREPGFGWRDDWAVRPGWNGVHDWNNDGVIDWRDDFVVGGARPWSGDYVKADWNRDGVIDAADGWRRLDDSWATGSWDQSYRGEGWRPETVSVREVPTGFQQDTTWDTVDGPWDTFGWGGAHVADWNRDGVIDWKDDLAWRGGVTTNVVADWNRDGVIDRRDGFGWGGVTTNVVADWNRDGVIDRRDGFGVRGVSTNVVADWNRAGFGWGGVTTNVVADWNRDGVIDRRDGFGVRGVSTNVVADWNRDGVIDRRDGFGYGGAVVADWNRDGVIDRRDGFGVRGGLSNVAVGGSEFVSVREVASPGVATTFGGSGISTLGSSGFVGAPTVRGNGSRQSVASVLRR